MADKQLELTPEQEAQQTHDAVVKLGSLLNHPGWLELCRIGEAQAKQREGQILHVATSLENLGEHNLLKGEAMGLRALMAIPVTFVAAHKDDPVPEVKKPDSETKPERELAP